MRQSYKATIALMVSAASLPVAGIAVQAQSALPAQIDRTTPRTQNGLTLLAVQGVASHLSGSPGLGRGPSFAFLSTR